MEISEEVIGMVEGDGYKDLNQYDGRGDSKKEVDRRGMVGVKFIV